MITALILNMVILILNMVSITLDRRAGI